MVEAITRRLRDTPTRLVTVGLLNDAADQLETMTQILDDLETSIRTGGLAGSPHTLAFVWSQNRVAILNGETTWEAQWGPHRRGDVRRAAQQ